MEVQSAFASLAGFGMADPFHIDDLLDFSNEDIAGPIGEALPLPAADPVGNAPPLAGTKPLLDGDEQQAAGGALCVPCDDLDELEWLSKFVEDSFSGGEITTSYRPMIPDISADVHFESYTGNDHFHSASPVSVLESSSTSSGKTSNPYRELSVPGRARSKRARTGGRVWGNSLILSSSSCTTDTESLSSDSNVLSGEHYSSPSSACALAVNSHHRPVILMTPPKAVIATKKSWKLGKSGKKGQDAAQPWRCLHCATQRTPQWRAGPMGPKTLCNACGVRYKSGRLLPEYRPAGSPGYIDHKHSNSHKKILEMRRQRETAIQRQHALLSSSAKSPQVSPYSHLQQYVEEMQEDDPVGMCTSQN